MYVVVCSRFRRMECRLRLKCDGTRAETRFRLSAKRTSPFKSAGASVQSTTGSRVVRFSGSNAGYTMLRGSVKSTGYLLNSPVFLSLPLPCVTMCQHVSTGLYLLRKVVQKAATGSCVRRPWRCFPSNVMFFRYCFSCLSTVALV
jgi:hypothetical protein